MPCSLAATRDRRQLRQLRRLVGRLADDDTLDCYGIVDHFGETRLTVFLRADRDQHRGIGWFGEGRFG